MEFKGLHTSEQLQEVLNASERHKLGVAIFKHSTRCSISAMALNRLQRAWSFSQDELPIYYLDLIQYRGLSNEIAETLQVVHESPQLILLKDRNVVYHASHYSIDVKQIEEFAYA